MSHSAQVGLGFVAFRDFHILTILSYKSMEFTEEVILGTLLGGTSQCNSSLESRGATLQNGMARSDFSGQGSHKER